MLVAVDRLGQPCHLHKTVSNLRFLRAITVTERAIARFVDCEFPISDATAPPRFARTGREVN